MKKYNLHHPIIFYIYYNYIFNFENKSLRKSIFKYLLILCILVKN
jgi:uncharacterized membrane-anchored protein